MLWTEGHFSEYDYIAPVQVAQSPPSLKNLIESEWLNDEVELHRDLTSAEIQELESHLSRSGKRVLLGYLAFGVLVVAAVLTIVARRFTALTGFALVFSATTIPPGWRARTEKHYFIQELQHRRITICREIDPDGAPIVVEYLEVSGAVWSANGVPAPWRGRTGD